MREVWYRYEDDHDTDFPVPWCRGIVVLRETPCGAWLDDWDGKRFVLRGEGKRFAYPEKRKALESYIIRKKRQMQHAQRSLDFARASLHNAEAIERGETPKCPRVNLFMLPETP